MLTLVQPPQEVSTAAWIAKQPSDSGVLLLLLLVVAVMAEALVVAAAGRATDGEMMILSVKFRHSNVPICGRVTYAFGLDIVSPSGHSTGQSNNEGTCDEELSVYRIVNNVPIPFSHSPRTWTK